MFATTREGSTLQAEGLTKLWSRQLLQFVEVLGDPFQYSSSMMIDKLIELVRQRTLKATNMLSVLQELSRDWHVSNRLAVEDPSQPRAN